MLFETVAIAFFKPVHSGCYRYMTQVGEHSEHPACFIEATIFKTSHRASNDAVCFGSLAANSVAPEAQIRARPIGKDGQDQTERCLNPRPSRTRSGPNIGLQLGIVK